MVVAIGRGVQLLQQRTHPLWRYNRSNDTTQAIREGFKNQAALTATLEVIYKGEKEDFVERKMFDDITYYKPIEEVSRIIQLICLTEAGFLYF